MINTGLLSKKKVENESVVCVLYFCFAILVVIIFISSGIDVDDTFLMIVVNYAAPQQVKKLWFDGIFKPNAYSSLVITS